MTAVDPLQIIALIVVLVTGALAVVVAAWEPEHRCKYQNACPHYRISQDQIAKRAHARKARDDFFHH